MQPILEFDTAYHCPTGELETVAPGLRRITANNPGPYTFRGTGTYVVGRDKVAVIDPGPEDIKHIDALLSALGDEQVTHIFVTHTHRDHSPGTRLLQQRTGALSYALGTHTAFQRSSALPRELDDVGDEEFEPDVVLSDNQLIEGHNWALRCLHTPGHASNHASFAQDEFQRVFIGDLVMGWSTPVLLPPDGHLGDYLASLRRMLQRNDIEYWPTHGASVTQPKTLVEQLIQHREHRTQAVLQAVQQGQTTLADIVNSAYPGLNPALMNAAQLSTLAAVVWLIENKQLRGDLTKGLSIQLQAM